MKKIFEGTVVSIKMQKTATVNVARKYPHLLYKKLIKSDKKISADLSNFSPIVGDRVRIAETKPISRTKHFKIVEVIKDGSA